MKEPDPEFIARQLRKPTGDFAEAIGQKMNEVNEALYDLTIDVMQPSPEDVILEIGFGTGKFFEKLFLHEDSLHVSGVDFSPEMVRIAKANNSSFITTGKLNIQTGNSKALPFPNDSFDKVFCNMVIFFWEEPEDHLKEIFRVLKPGGSFYSGIRSRESMLTFPFVEHGFQLYELNQWEEILNQNGFKSENVETKLDPPLEFEEQTIQLESCVIVAKKHET